MYLTPFTLLGSQACFTKTYTTTHHTNTIVANSRHTNATDTVAHSSPQSATVGHSRLQRIPHSVTRLAEREPTRRPRFARYGDRPAAVGTGARGRTGATAAAAARRRAPWPAGSRPCSAAERRATASRASRAGGGPSRRTCQRDPVRASLSDGRVVRLRRGKAGPAG
jgi:hypothetical protein